MANNPSRRTPVFPRHQPVGGYVYQRINAVAASDTPVGDAATSGQFLGRVICLSAGTSMTLTLKDGAGGATICAFTPIAGQSYLFDIRVSGGLMYQYTGTTPGDIVVCYLDYDI